jgi:hypothetical protein
VFIGEHDLQGAIPFFYLLSQPGWLPSETRQPFIHPTQKIPCSLFVGISRVRHTYFIDESRINADGVLCCPELNEGLHSEGAWYRGAE